MNMNNIELKIIEKEINISEMTTIELINFIILEVENVKELYKKGLEKKQLVLDIIEDFIRDADNMFCKANKYDIIYSLLNLKNAKLIEEIIDNIVYCANGNLKLNSKSSSKSSSCSKKFFCIY